MYIDELRDYCMMKAFTTESFPFDEVTLVFKVMNKMFAIVPLDEEEKRVNLKCEPARALELRDNYEAVQPGWHMNKAHWNTVYLERDLPDKEIRKLIDHSYDLILASLPKKRREKKM